MPIEIIPAAQAMETVRRNAQARYPRPDLGSERLFPFPRPAGRPSFRIARDARVFTMGSCFAREVDKALKRIGFDIISRDGALAASVEREGRDEALYNKYVVHSILNEIRWALDPACPYPGAAALAPSGSNGWCDLQLGGTPFSGTQEEMLAFREVYCASMRRIAEADVVIITLGLIEAWRDEYSGLFLNIAPNPRMVKAEPDRFTLHVLDYAEVLDGLEQIHALLARYGKPGAKMLVTVSPVALLSTFRDQDVLVANTYSKAVQRAAVEAFVQRHEGVDYFPSYEFVALGDPKTNWGADYRHVHPQIVQRIMADVMARYVEDFDGVAATAAASAELNILYRAEDHLGVARRYGDLGPGRLDLGALYRVGLSMKKLERFAEAKEVFAACLARDPAHENAQRNFRQMDKMLRA